MDNQEWLASEVKVATPNKELPVVITAMGICFCGEPCITQIEDGKEGSYTHAISMVEECGMNPRNDPPQ